MQTGTITSTINIGGVGFTSTTTRLGEGLISHVVALPAGLAGAISAAGGVDGLATGHGLVNTDVVDVHWVDAGVQKHRRGLVVTAAANAVTFAGGSPAGDALPAEDTAVIVSKQIPILTAWIGNDTEMIAVGMSQPGVVDLREAAADVTALVLGAAASWSWVASQGVTNPLADKSLAQITVSNGSTNLGICRIGVLYQSVE